MTSKEINRDIVNAFLARAISHAWAAAIDAEHGLRVVDVEVTDRRQVRIELDGGHLVFIDITHFVPHRVPEAPQGEQTPCNTTA